MQHSNAPAGPHPHYSRALADGGTVSLSGATVADPDTGESVPAATLLLPAWRLRDLSRALRGWSATTALVAMTADWPPDETNLADALTTTANLLEPPRPPESPASHPQAPPA